MYEILLLLLFLRFCYVIYTEIVITKEICTITYLFFKRTFKWEDLNTKNIESFEQRLGGRNNFAKRGVVFSIDKDYHTPRIIGLSPYLLYCANPRRSFIVLFKPEGDKNAREAMGLVEEKHFLDKMKEFGIILTEDVF